jgi:hypothetical protein
MRRDTVEIATPRARAAERAGVADRNEIAEVLGIEHHAKCLASAKTCFAIMQGACRAVSA